MCGSCSCDNYSTGDQWHTVSCFIGRKMNVLHLTKENRMVNITAVKELLAMGLPTGLQFSITAIGSMVMQSANNGLGSVCVSGFTAGMRIKQFAMCPFDAIATSASVFCSQNMGARQPERIKKGLRQGVAIATIYGLLIGLVLIFGGRTLSMIFVKNQQRMSWMHQENICGVLDISSGVSVS